MECPKKGGRGRGGGGKRGSWKDQRPNMTKVPDKFVLTRTDNIREASFDVVMSYIYGFNVFAKPASRKEVFYSDENV